MSEPKWEMTRAWRELLDGLAELDGQFLEGPRAVGDERTVAEGYRMLTTGLGGRPRRLPVRRPGPTDVRRRQHTRPPATVPGAATIPTPTTRWPPWTQGGPTG